MQQRALLISVWILATAVMMAVAYGAINLVGSQVNERPIAATPTTQASESSTSGASVESSTTTVDSSDQTITSVSEDEGATSTSLDETTSTSVNEGTTSTSLGSSTTTSVPSGSTSTTTPSTTSTSSPDTTTSTTEPDDDNPVVETGPFVVSSDGGVITVSCLDDEIQFLGASPNSGFSVEIEETGPSRVRVEFEGASDSWRVEATCSDGVVSSDVSES